MGGFSISRSTLRAKIRAQDGRTGSGPGLSSKRQVPGHDHDANEERQRAQDGRGEEPVDQRVRGKPNQDEPAD